MSVTGAQAYRQDRLLVLAGTVALSLLSWGILVSPRHGHSITAAWDPGSLLISVVMWAVMMVAMMLPSATPMILAFIRLLHQRQPRPVALTLSWLFVAGYLLAWTAFSLVAGLAQWGLHGLGLMTTAMGRTDPLPGGVMLMAAGAFQWSGFKNACLSQCRSPLDFLLHQWRDGTGGALTMGLHHGTYCVGCCWALMLLMFAGGVMNLAWMGAIAVYVLLEKLVPGLRQLEHASGWLLVGGGLALTAHGIYLSIA